MKRFTVVLAVCLYAALGVRHSALAQAPQLINYQGRLLDGTNLFNGSVGLSLRLFNVSSGGTKLYEDSNSVTVADGLYATFIGDHPTNNAFLAALTNAAVWVEVAVNGAALSPRERLASVGYALATRGLLVTTNDSVIHNPSLNPVAADSLYVTLAGGRQNSIGTNADYAAIGGGFNNAVAANSLYATIAGGTGNGIGTNSGSATIGGGANNDVAASSLYATIAGGNVNQIGTDSDVAAIGGGLGNTVAATSKYATIAGGLRNSIGNNAEYVAIGGGASNSVAANSLYATVAGGSGNDIGTNADYTAIGGGLNNNISNNSPYAVIIGGRDNVVGVSATNALAAGRRARANHRGAFVWGDDTNADVASTTSNQVTFRAAGGFRVLNGELLAGGGLRVGGTGTAFAHVQSDTAVLGPGTNTMSYAVVFPAAFGTVPRVQVTLRNDPLFDVPDTFAATLRKVTTTNFVVNVQRVDSAGGWAQQLRLEWTAWE